MSVALNNAVQVFLIALLTVLSKFLIDWINTKRDEIKLNIENETAKKYIDMISNTITQCVAETNQTYVNSLKDQNLFDKDAQTEAFNKTFKNVVALLDKEAINYLMEATKDVDAYLRIAIEAEVAKQKQ